MSLLARPGDLPRLAGTSPFVLVAEGVSDPSPIASAALEVWIAAPRGGAVLLHPLGTRPPEMAAAVEAPPPGAVALVVPDAAMERGLRRWWTAATGLPVPPVVVAASGVAALPGILAALAEALTVALLREAAALRALSLRTGGPDGQPADAVPAAPEMGDSAEGMAASRDGADRVEEPAVPGLDAVPEGWTGLRVLEGGVDLVALGEEPLRPLLRVVARETAILAVPLPFNTAMQAPAGGESDTAMLTIALANGSGRGASVAAWLRPAGEAPRDLTDLSLSVPGSAWTGWQDLAEDDLALTLPLASRDGRAVLAIGLRAGVTAAVVEVRAVTPGNVPRAPAQPWPLPAEGTRTTTVATPMPEPTDAGPAGSTPRPLPPVQALSTELFAPAPARRRHPVSPVAPDLDRLPSLPLEGTGTLAQPTLPDSPATRMPVPDASAGTDRPPAPASGARHAVLTVKDLEETEGYRHIDFEIEELDDGTRRWDRVRLKFAVKAGEPRLEFRLASDWPPVFEEWLGRQSDRHGPFLRVFQGDIQEFLDLVGDPRDAALMAALLSMLPAWVEEALGLAGVAAGEIPGWVAAAQALQAEGARRP